VRETTLPGAATRARFGPIIVGVAPHFSASLENEGVKRIFALSPRFSTPTEAAIDM